MRDGRSATQGFSRLAPENIANLRGQLHSALVADALDTLGMRRQTLGPDILPLSGTGTLVGHAFTIRAETVDSVPESPYVGLTAAIDALTIDDVYVFATARSDAYAGWGELVSIAARAAGAVGMLTDGLVRDTHQVHELGFPVFARGTVPNDINGRAEVVGHGEPVVIDGVMIAPGDLIVADRDGVAVVPTSVLDEVLGFATSKRLDESKFRDALAEGMSATEAFSRFHVL